MKERSNTPDFDEYGKIDPLKMSRNIFWTEYGWGCVKNLLKGERESIIDDESNVHTIVVTGIGSDGHMAPESLISEAEDEGSVHFAKRASRKLLGFIKLLKNTDADASAELVAKQIMGILDDALDGKSEEEARKVVVKIKAHSLGAYIAKKACLIIDQYDQEHNTDYLSHIKLVESHAGANGPIELQEEKWKKLTGKILFGQNMINTFSAENINGVQEEFNTLEINQRHLVYQNDKVLPKKTQCPKNQVPLHVTGDHFEVYS